MKKAVSSTWVVTKGSPAKKMPPTLLTQKPASANDTKFSPLQLPPGDPGKRGGGPGLQDKEEARDARKEASVVVCRPLILISDTRFSTPLRPESDRYTTTTDKARYPLMSNMAESSWNIPFRLSSRPHRPSTFQTPLSGARRRNRQAPGFGAVEFSWRCPSKRACERGCRLPAGVAEASVNLCQLHIE